jgi:hypothetical protein
MTILTFPTIRRPSAGSYRLRGNTQAHRSPLDGTEQTLEMPGAVWEITVSWDNLGTDDQRVLAAFLAQLRGAAGRFYYSPTAWQPRRATGGGTPLINGAAQSGSSLVTDGWSASVQVMRAGDWLSYTDALGRRRLHMVTADVSSSAGGAATLAITPPIRRAGAENAAVEVAAPSGVFRLPDDAAPEMAIRPPMLGRVTLAMVEALV